MIPCFPDPYPDEIFYSICSRFSDHVSYHIPQQVILDLFGTEHAEAAVTFPSHLDYLVDHLPSDSTYTCEYFIEKHTLLPFYGAFLPQERLQLLLSDMRGGNAAPAHRHAGISVSPIPLPKRLRFCTLCIVEDRKRQGECYWHRVHQLPGVEVCPLHNVYLQNSDVHTGSTKKRRKFVSAEYASRMKWLKLATQSVSHNKVFSDIAQDCYWLLQQHLPSQDLKTIRDRYLKQLIKLDLATPNGTVRSGLLAQKFLERFSPPCLEYLHCNFVGVLKDIWLARLLHSNSSRTSHPLHHILLIRFLGYTVESFFTLSPEYKPFGDGPWPCLNPISEHYKQPQIEKCHIIYNSKTGTRKPTGIFSCNCGYEYSLIGPDRSIEDHSKLNKVRSFGSLWESELKRLWEDKSISLTKIALQLGVSRRTVKKHAYKLGLSLSIRSANGIPLLSKKMQIEASKIELYRTRWINAIEEDPKAGVKELRHKVPAIYIWLYRHDLIWLKEHTPSKREMQYSTSHINWGKRDLQTAEEVRNSALRIKNTSGRPIQVTLSRIAKDIDHVTWLHRRLDKLPLTAKALAEVTESREAFAIRRVQWVTDFYLQERTYVTRQRLIRHAGVQWVLDAGVVKDAIEVALITVNSSNGISYEHVT